MHRGLSNLKTHLMHTNQMPHSAGELFKNEQRQATQGLACHDAVADTVTMGLPKDSGGHVQYNRLTPCFFLIQDVPGRPAVNL